MIIFASLYKANCNMKETGTILLADSGSTKTSWRAWQGEDPPLCIETAGINPVLMDTETIVGLLDGQLLSPSAPADGDRNALADVREIHFYGAGCLPTTVPTVEKALEQTFPAAEIHVCSDLLGAARALCGHSEGIACILGTGSNSCLYDGRQICAHTPPLGYILGDEGSGAALGKRLLGDLLKGLLPKAVSNAFTDRYRLTAGQIIEQVYRRPLPNRYLAGFTYFMAEHRREPEMHRLLTESFESFFRRNLVAYARPDLPVHMTGSVAHVFADEIKEAARATGFTTGRIIPSPVEGMIAYHRGVHGHKNIC